MKRNNKIGKQDATAFLFDAKGKDGVDGGGFASKQAGKKATPRPHNGREPAGREPEKHAGYELPSSVCARCKVVFKRERSAAEDRPLHPGL